MSNGPLRNVPAIPATRNTMKETIRAAAAFILGVRITSGTQFQQIGRSKPYLSALGPQVELLHSLSPICFPFVLYFSSTGRNIQTIPRGLARSYVQVTGLMISPSK